jgi:hypothetical protein
MKRVDYLNTLGVVTVLLIAEVKKYANQISNHKSGILLCDHVAPVQHIILFFFRPRRFLSTSQGLS